MTCPSSESQTVVELGFELESDSKAHVLIVSTRHAALHGELTLGKSDFPLWCWRFVRMMLPTLQGPGMKIKAETKGNPRASGHPMFSLVCIFDHERRDLPEGRHITTLQRQVCRDHQSFPLESPSWVQSEIPAVMRHASWEVSHGFNRP